MCKQASALVQAAKPLRIKKSGYCPTSSEMMSSHRQEKGYPPAKHKFSVFISDWCFRLWICWVLEPLVSEPLVSEPLVSEPLLDCLNRQRVDRSLLARAAANPINSLLFCSQLFIVFCLEPFDIVHLNFLQQCHGERFDLL